MVVMGAYCPEDGQTLGPGMNLRSEEGWQRYLKQFEPARM